MENEQKTDNAVFEQLTEINLLALCIWAEARNQGLEGMQAVGSVILNRASRPGWWGRDIKSVILAPKQFSCFNSDDPKTPRDESDPQREKLVAIAADFISALLVDALLRACRWIAQGLIEKQLLSNVGKAVYYHTKSCDPKWDDNKKPVATVKDHLFYV